VRYQVVEDRYLREFDIQLYPGDEFVDGDLEPDLVAELLVYGVILPAEQSSVGGGAATEDYTAGVDWAEGEDAVVFSETVNYNTLTRPELDTLAVGRGINIEPGWN
jgi:hypothetical protein